MLRRKHRGDGFRDEDAYGLRTLSSPRLRLVAATASLLQMDLEDVGQLAGTLEAEVPVNWPPDLYDRGAMDLALRQLQQRPANGWTFWYLIARPDGCAKLIGVCGFTGLPDATGCAEMGYAVLSQYRNHGYATEAVARLLQWAFSHPQVREVRAETLPHLTPSLRVMEKTGFVPAGPGSERGVMRYAVSRPDRS